MTIEQAAKLISHPLRVLLLTDYLASGGGLSPSDLAAGLGEPIGNVSYHTRILARAGAITLVRTKQVRGAVEHYYTATQDGERLLLLRDAWEGL